MSVFQKLDINEFSGSQIWSQWHPSDTKTNAWPTHHGFRLIEWFILHWLFVDSKVYEQSYVWQRQGENCTLHRPRPTVMENSPKVQGLEYVCKLPFHASLLPKNYTAAETYWRSPPSKKKNKTNKENIFEHVLCSSYNKPINRPNDLLIFLGVIPTWEFLLLDEMGENAHPARFRSNDTQSTQWHNKSSPFWLHSSQDTGSHHPIFCHTERSWLRLVHVWK